MESITSASGSRRAAVSSTVSRSVSQSSSSASGTSPRREARSRICCSLSSPLTYSVFRPALAYARANWSMSVLFPIPGSPPTSSSEPGTMPPPSTRSSSRMPVLARSVEESDTSASGTAPSRRTAPTGTQRPRPAGFGAAPLVLVAGASLAVFHSPHAGQCPNQRGCSLPQAVQKNEDFGVFAGFVGLPLDFIIGHPQRGVSEHLHVHVLLRIRLDVRDQGPQLGD